MEHLEREIWGLWKIAFFWAPFAQQTKHYLKRSDDGTILTAVHVQFQR